MTNLFISYYRASTPERQAEIDYCLQKNCENPLFDFIYIVCDDSLFNRNALDNIRSVKLKLIHCFEKPTYKKFIDSINERTNILDVNIISNADIIFDETLSSLYKLKENDCWALSRWEMNPDFTNHPQQIQIFGDSQDCWIFRSKIKSLNKSDFPLGKMGCDNRIAYEIKKAGYNIINPSKTILTWHLHNTNVRGYNPAVRNENTVVSQPYLNVPITAL